MKHILQKKLRSLGTFGRLVEIVFVLLLNLKAKQNGPLYLRHVLEDLGGGIIKLGQILALRYDLLPSRYCKMLESIFNRVPPISPQEVRSVFFHEFQKNPEEAFDEFAYKPLAAASFGQVHKAKLKGIDVVIKIQRPDAKQLAIADMAIVRVLAVFIRFFGFSMLSRDLVEEWIEWTQGELDYEKEAYHIRKLRGLYKDDDLAIPRVVLAYTSKRVLCEEYFEGKTLNEILGESDLPAWQRKELAHQILIISLKQYFKYGFFHSDPHPGNIMLLTDGRLGIIDFGIMGEAFEKRGAFARFVKAAAQGDMQTSLVHFVEVMENCLLGKEAESLLQGTKLPYGLEFSLFKTYAMKFLEAEFRPLLDAWIKVGAQKDAPIHEKSTARHFLTLILAAHQYGMTPPRRIMSFVRGLVIIDMVCLILEPEFNMVEVVQLFFEEHGYLLEEQTMQSTLPVVHSHNQERRQFLIERYIEYIYQCVEKIYERGAVPIHP